MTKSMREWQAEIGAWAVEKGWHLPPLCETPAPEFEIDESLSSLDGARDEPSGIDHDRIASKLCLVHSEISEALEALRDHRVVTYLKGGKPEGLEIELADAIIRILHLAEDLGLDMDQAVELKMAYNRHRPYKHGGKAI